MSSKRSRASSNHPLNFGDRFFRAFSARTDIPTASATWEVMPAFLMMTSLICSSGGHFPGVLYFRFFRGTVASRESSPFPFSFRSSIDIFMGQFVGDVKHFLIPVNIEGQEAGAGGHGCTSMILRSMYST